MGAFEKLFRRPKGAPTANSMNKYFELLDGYTPCWTTYEGGVYEMELTRSCIHAFASHASKLQPEVTGADLSRVGDILAGRPNPFMTTSQFLYKVATILETCNTVYVVPMFDAFGKLCGYYPVVPSYAEMMDVDGEPWMRYTFWNGKKAAIEYRYVGVLNKFTLNSDVVGESNDALRPTMQLIETQNQGIAEGIKNSATYRFMATVNNFAKASDLTKERKQFTADNFSGEGAGGILLFPNTYTNVAQITNASKVVDVVGAEQMQTIQTRVFDYFGSNVDVLQNKVNGDAWAAYYEGKIEPFAIQLSQAMTVMTYTPGEIARNNAIVWSANRLQYMTNKDKMDVSSQMFDRAIFCRNDIMDIWNRPHVEGGDKFYIRRDYIEVDKLRESGAIEHVPAPGGPDDNGGAEHADADE